MKKEHIINLQGKDFILFAGLLEIAHEEGLSEIKTEVIELRPAAIIKATVTTEKGTFTGIGDACVDNVNKMIAKHYIRMAETRAIARALRFATNIGMTALEEMGGDEKEESPKPKEAPKPKESPAPWDDDFGGTVVEEGEPVITEKQRARLFALAKQNGFTDEELKNLLGSYGYETSKEVKRKEYQKICDTIEGK